MIYGSKPIGTPPTTSPAPQLTARARRRQARLAAILAAAEAQVIDGGFDALSIHGVAKAVDLTPGALYRYFDSMISAALLSTSRQARCTATSTVRPR